MSEGPFGLTDDMFFLIFIAFGASLAWLVFRMQKFDYKIEEEYVIMTWHYFRLFPIKKKIKLDSIIEVQEIKLGQFFSSLLRNPWPGLWGKLSRKMVLIRKKGIFGTILISPSNPTAFVEELKAKVTLVATRK